MFFSLSCIKEHTFCFVAVVPFLNRSTSSLVFTKLKQSGLKSYFDYGFFLRAGADDEFEIFLANVKARSLATRSQVRNGELPFCIHSVKPNYSNMVILLNYSCNHQIGFYHRKSNFCDYMYFFFHSFALSSNCMKSADLIPNMAWLASEPNRMIKCPHLLV